MTRLLGTLAVVLLLASGAGPVLASHAQTVNGWTLTFQSRNGNEWWVEAVVGGASASQVTRVEAMDTGGPWVELTKRAWGSWAASFHVEPGHTVRFRATMPDGTQVLSCAFTHPAGVEQCGAFAATFTGVGGNEWWVQAHVTASLPLAGVDARVDGGAWQPLTLRSWGDWAASLHVPNGSLVELRARSQDGQEDVSGAYRWPDATPAQGGAPGFRAGFRPVAGNEWWVETYVDADRPLAKVQARIEGLGWHDLAKTSWGSWAASFHVPEGSLVRFRAIAGDGATNESGLYRWPGATPAGPWPREGSFATFHSEAGERSPSGDFAAWDEVNVSFAFSRGQWSASCEGWHYESHGEGTPTNRTRILSTVPGAPPTGPPRTSAGANVTVQALTGCDDGWPWGNLTVQGPATRATNQSGQPVAASGWRGAFEPECQCQSAEATWSDASGVTLAWSFSGLTTWQRGWLKDTDSPL